MGYGARGEGLDHLERSATGDRVTAFHVEAAIAAAHITAENVEATDWGLIVSLYDRLMTIAPSPVVALNRAIAIAQLRGPEAGLGEIALIGDRQRLQRYPFLPAALGELESRQGHHEDARRHFAAALALARNPVERRFLEKRLRTCASLSGAPE